MMQTKRENKRVIYDGISISVRALTVFILLGLILMMAVIWYGAYMGNRAERTIPVSAEDESYLGTVSKTTETCGNLADGRNVLTKKYDITKINQRFIDKIYHAVL